VVASRPSEASDQVVCDVDGYLGRQLETPLDAVTNVDVLRELIRDGTVASE
jgi:hypothetical protein